MSVCAEIDVAIFGGGIAGLWLANRLRRLGFDAILFEKTKLGAGQTLASQGILHSGVKYALDPGVKSPAQSLAAMPGLWMECIAGRGEVDLRGTQIIAPNQCVFTMGGLKGWFAGAVAAKAFRSAFEAVAPKDFPEVFRAASFNGNVFRLHEPVIDTRSAVTALAAGAVCCRAAPREVRRENENVKEVVLDDAAQTRISARAWIFTSGEGNEWFANALGLDKNKATQRRPLRMFLACGVPHTLWAHWLVPEPKPRLTITTHNFEGENVWYIGGDIAEKTVGLDHGDALRQARAEASAAFPKIDWKAVRWAIHDVNRAEPAANKLLPSGPVLKTVGNAALAWPAKLVLAPALAAQAVEWLAARNIAPSNKKTTLPLPVVEPGRYPWEEAQWVKV